MQRRKTFSHATKNFTRFYDFVLGVMIANCSAPISTRKQGGLIGAGLGAGTGAIIGTTVLSRRKSVRSSAAPSD
jgi:hypothetical protein